MLGKISPKYLIIGSITFLVSIVCLIGDAFADTSSAGREGISQNILGAGIDVNSFPIGVAVNPVTNMIYITNAASNTVSVINGVNDKIEHTIAVGLLPYDVDVDPATNKIYITNKNSNNISVLDGDTNSIIGTISVSSPVGIDIDSEKSWIYVTNINNNTVSRIDAITNAINTTAKVGKAPYTVDIKSGRDPKIYVTNSGSDSISVIDGNSFVTLKNITVGNLPVGLAANSNTSKVYVADRADNTVHVIDAVSDKVLKKLSVGDQPDGIDINFQTGDVYVTNTNSSSVSVIDGNTDNITKTIQVNRNIPELDSEELPPSLRFPNVATFVDNNDRTGKTYVTNTGSNSVSVIDSNTYSLLVGLTIKNDPSNQGEIMCADVKNKGDNFNFNGSSEHVWQNYGKEFECTCHPK